MPVHKNAGGSVLYYFKREMKDILKLGFTCYLQGES